MTTPAQVEANRRNAALSTSPPTPEGKARSAQNALRHGFTGRLPVAVPRGPFAEDPEEIQEFVERVVAELAPGGLRERSEATHIAALYVRRARLVRLEAEALAHATRVSPWDLTGPLAPRDTEAAGTEAAAARGLGGELLERLPRYEAHVLGAATNDDGGDVFGDDVNGMERPRRPDGWRGVDGQGGGAVVIRS